MLGRGVKMFGRADDDGVTIVELLVALTIVMIAFAALASTVFASFAGIRNNEARVRATAIANEAIEGMTAMSWDSLGLYELDGTLTPKRTFGGEAEGDLYESEPLVLFGDPVPVGVPTHAEPVPTEVDGLTYTVERWVTFVAQDGNLFDDGTSDLKRMVAIVSWNVSGTERSVRVEGLRGPNPEDLLSLRIRFLELVSNNIDDSGTQRPERVKLVPALNDVDGTELLDADGYTRYTNADVIEALVEVGEVGSTVKLYCEDRCQDFTLTAPPPDDGTTVTRLFVINEKAYEFFHGAVTFKVEAEGADAIASNLASIRFYQPLEILSAEVQENGTKVSELSVCGDGSSYFVDGAVTVATEIQGVSPVEAGRSLPTAPDTPPDTPSVRLEWPSAAAPVAYNDSEQTKFGGTYDFVVDANTVAVLVGQSEVTFTLNAARVVDQGGIPVIEDSVDALNLSVALIWPAEVPTCAP